MTKSFSDLGQQSKLMRSPIIKAVIRTAIILLVEILLMIYYFYFSAYKLPDILDSPTMFLLFPVLTLVSMLVISLVVRFLFFRKGNYFSVYTILINSSLLIYVVVLAYYFNTQWNYNKTHGYNAGNQTLIDMADNNGHQFIGFAFSKLQSEFTFPRDLDLHSYVAKDTAFTINNVSKKSQLVYFIYGFTNDNNNKEYFSKVYVTDLTSQLIFYNKKVSDDEEYNYVRILKKEKETVKGYKTSMTIEVDPNIYQ